jgi:hypothetical protein
MKKEITINIDNKGFAPGTVGWLCENVDSMLIGKTRDGNQGAWLKDKEGKTLTVLAIRGFYDEDTIDEITRNYGYRGDMDCAFICSDACWEKIEELTAAAVEKMEGVWESMEGDKSLKIS